MIHIEKYKSEDGLFRTFGIYCQSKFVVEFRANFEGIAGGFTVCRSGYGEVTAEVFVLFFTARVTVFLPRRIKIWLSRARRSK